MYHFLKSRYGKAAAATLAGLMLAGPLSPAATAIAAPAIDRNQPAPTPNADPDPFYTPPASIPVGAPGDIIRARPAKAGPPTARKLANAWQVMYLSTNTLGQRNVVTGTILVPKTATASTPVVALAPGTTGQAFRCAVSRFINSGAFYEQAAVNDMLKAGYAVAVTDYEGYHENPKTTYIVGKAMGAALLDVARAASRLPEAGLSATPKVILRGFSQGGGATMWAGQMEPTYAPELDLVAVAGGGVPSSLANVALSLERKPAFGFELAAMVGLNNAYPDELRLDDYLLPEGVDVINKVETTDCTIELLTGYSGKQSADYTDPSPFGAPEWLTRVGENTLGADPINAPVFQYHASNDPIVPFNQAKTLRDRYCAAGVKVQWKVFDTGHITTVARGNADVNAYIADRLAGKPVPSNC